MKILSLNKPYIPALDKKETEHAIFFVKNFFQTDLAKDLNLMRVTAPLFVLQDTGINDDLNGTEKPVSFLVKDNNSAQAAVVHSLAKWKRIALATYGCSRGEGVYTDMNAIRTEEELDNIHSVYVDQWDWEMAVSHEDRNLDFLKFIVKRIFAVMRKLEQEVEKKYSIKAILPKDIYFIHTEELEEMYPKLTPKERENKICKKYSAVFIIGIGSNLKDGMPHDGRALDYDDWSTDTHNGFKGLNGDVLFWNPVLDQAFEISSMGIRVDKKALLRQLELHEKQERLKLKYHTMLMNDEIPLSIGGGIGQSRLCMFFLRKAHIGEVQASIWPDTMITECANNNIFLL
ncbi:aspartate--ammonia ligase [Candidatus Babeliales bacterium]|nr:aspartate--ammonia ligase [Candidatus Babeliales bacterium]MCF7899776.1 aspartate--ammonia ligase [Candidatus Babeliales bacterium]